MIRDADGPPGVLMPYQDVYTEPHGAAKASIDGSKSENSGGASLGKGH